MRRTVRADGWTIEYELTQTARQSMALRAVPEPVKVFAPRGVRLRDADDFVRAHAPWIVETRARFQQYKARYAAEHPAADGAQLLLAGRVMTIRVVPAVRVCVRVADDDTMIVETPNGAQEAVRACLRAFLIERAHSVLKARTADLAKVIGKCPCRVAIREQKTRWGSCSALGNLNFNWKLIMAPPEALDYVVIHELCHLYELNHSAKFWQRVARYQPDYLLWKKWLKENGQMLGL
ncbi:MAG: SprT family zinc-dependent metalloprotease [Clostridia bacterium]